MPIPSCYPYSGAWWRLQEEELIPLPLSAPPLFSFIRPSFGCSVRSQKTLKARGVLERFKFMKHNVEPWFLSCHQLDRISFAIVSVVFCIDHYVYQSNSLSRMQTSVRMLTDYQPYLLVPTCFIDPTLSEAHFVPFAPLQSPPKEHDELPLRRLESEIKAEFSPFLPPSPHLPNERRLFSSSIPCCRRNAPMRMKMMVFPEMRREQSAPHTELSQWINEACRNKYDNYQST